jgi:hypothetical protein
MRPEDLRHPQIFQTRHPVYAASLASVGPDSAQVDRDIHMRLHKLALKQHTELINNGSEGVTVGKGEGVWVTLDVPDLSEPPLTQQQVRGMREGSYRLYVYVWARWRDAPHDLDLCQWLQPITTDTVDNSRLIWHLCGGLLK